jgi:hypothetical protein
MAGAGRFVSLDEMNRSGSRSRLLDLGSDSLRWGVGV